MATTKATTLAHTLASTTSSTADLDYAKTLNDTGVTSTEFDKLDGLTATTDELNLVDGSVTGPLSNRNFVYNGDFKIWQRSDSTSSVNIGNGAFQADRWKAIHDVSPEGVEFARSTDVPTGYGFANSLKITCDATDTNISAGHAVSLVQEFESQDLIPWCYGTANAKNLMLSFWVKTNLTGSHSIGLIKHDNTRYGIPINYTVSSANTWEKKEILISPTAGSTSLITSSAGAIDNDNGHGASLIWNLASGSNYQSTNNTWTTSIDKRIMGTSSDQNFVGSTSNNFYITGVQLELGSVATPFEHRNFADELRRCQRYCVVYGDGTNGAGEWILNGAAPNTTTLYANYLLPVLPRSTPTVSCSGLMRISDNFDTDNTANPPSIGTQPNTQSSFTNGGRVYLTGFSGLTYGRNYGSGRESGEGKTTFSMEL